MTHRERVVQQIRARRALGIAARRRRMLRQATPRAIQLDYWRAIQPFLDVAKRAVAAWVLPALPRLLHEAAGSVARLDADDRPLEMAKRAAAGAIRPRDLEALARRFGEKVSDFQRGQLRNQIQAALGVELHQLEPKVDERLAAFADDNARLIRSVPEQYLDEVAQVVRDGVAAGMRHEALAELLEERYEIADRRAALIARDQVGKLYGQLNQVRQEALGVASFVWRTAHDERVREEHAELDGEEFEWGDPPDGEVPGEPINCRCSAEPVLREILGEVEESD